jgi:erythronate-4-phosphate dehydrogenase
MPIPSPITILVDENIPFAQQLLAGLGHVIPKPGRLLLSSDLKGVDALLVRSVTQVNEALLSQADRLTFVGTATIGTDHIDQALLQQRGVGFSSAPGCNRIAVGEYVTTGLLAAAQYRQLTLAGKTLAVVGAGNTGSEVARRARALGMKVRRYDPPQARTRGAADFCEFSDVLKADVISLHVPLIRSGEDPTYHLFDQANLSHLSPDQILINACRGEVVDNQALLAQAKAGRAPLLIWDVWESEPHVLAELVPYTFIATPHIAGYSLEGKMRGTSMVYRALCEHAQMDRPDISGQLLPEPAFSSVSLNQPPTQEVVGQLTRLIYNIFDDDRRFRRDGLSATGFDQLRRDYPERREFSSLFLQGQVPDYLAELGFRIKR